MKVRVVLGIGVVVCIAAVQAAAQPFPVGSEFRVNTYTTASQQHPVVAADASGNFLVVWENTAHFWLFGQRYDSDGNPSGSEFQVNTHTTFGKGYPGVATGWERGLHRGVAERSAGRLFGCSRWPTLCEHRHRSR